MHRDAVRVHQGLHVRRTKALSNGDCRRGISRIAEAASLL